ncbi:MAG: DNA glycosylase [Oscillospiraceae bacterium]
MVCEIIENPTFKIAKPKVFNLSLILDCGQCFRWEKDENGVFSGVVDGRVFRIAETQEELLFFGADEKDFEEVLRAYLDFDRNYEDIIKNYKKDKYLKKATCEFLGIRILKQEPWEALCSFIISQNNNIPRIKGIIKRLCEAFGDDLGDGFYSFPTPQKLSTLTIEDLAPLRSGFRAKYILDAASKVANGEIDFNKISKNDLEYGRQELQRIKGVGKKVAECTLLYGFLKIDAFPIDVWVKRIMAEMYPEGLPLCTKGTEGIAQQYLFHWRRNRINDDD